jgi:hypothetical protein
MKTLPEIIKELRGQMCWGVQWDSQLNLELSFGEPHLDIREPYISKSKSKRIKEIASYRNVKVKGKWWLWIFCANWKIRIKDSLVATNASPVKKKIMVLARLDGQKLENVQINSETGNTNFIFDLGATLQTKRYSDDDADIWTLY